MSWILPAPVSWTPTEYGGVLLDAASGEFWTLNPTASTALAAILAHADLTRVTERLAAEYEGDHETMAVDVPQFLAELRSAGLVVPA
ncbi:lasso peptide biosynthesis PqqD family chaperone [Micromonospora sp. NPDC051300]|uniref:lasso peptide biosynthesis PqqD family chaperone n=1 Tax=Micromonospora sp. NPDC051300 TaxID=3364286 RepID=UPI0037894370